MESFSRTQNFCAGEGDVTVINGENQDTKGIVQTKEVGTLIG